jgi:asparagine synthase (glutamine-hydrolysing)
MCSICGGNFHKESILKASKTLSHRGKNFSASFSDNFITLAHNRLSIIDLSNLSNQPLIDENLILIFNGEIYNFLNLKEILIKNGFNFKTKSDSEVLLKSFQFWGESCVQKFNGDFAFCIYNSISKKLFCARDRVGNKPFFYYFKNNKFFFASELRAFREIIQNEFNTQKLGDALLFSINDNNQETIFKDIFNLPPAHTLSFDLKSNKLKIKNYWKLITKNSNQKFDLKEFNKKLEEFEELFFNAVKLRLISDVKVAGLLSGGVDSSLIAYFSSKFQEDIEFFSIVYDEFSEIDETKFIKILEEKFKLKINYLYPEFKDLKEDLDNLILTQSDIFRSLSIFVQYYLLKKASQKVRVVLSGQGADELFGGYYHHVARFIAKDKLEFLNRVKIYKNLALEEFKLGVKFNLNKDLKRELLIEDNLKNLNYINEILKDYKPNWDLLLQKFEANFQKALLNDTLTLNLPQLLRYEDRNAMAFSVENRTPFSDYRIIEFAHSLPNSFKFKNGFSKYFLRVFANKFLPDSIAFRIDKKGFEAPDKVWLKRLNLDGDLVKFRVYIFLKLKEFYA